MSAKTLQAKATPALVETLISLCEEHEKFDMTRRGQTLWKQMTAIVAELVRRGDGAAAVVLMADPRPFIRYYGAQLAADIDPGKMRKTLIEIAEGDYGKWLKDKAAKGLALRFRDYYEKVFADSIRSCREEEARDPDFAAYMESLRETSRRLHLGGFKRYEHVLTDPDPDPQEDPKA